MAIVSYSHVKRVSISRKNIQRFNSNIRQSPFPITSSTALKDYWSSLSVYERTEITNYTHIYFLGEKAEKLEPPFTDAETYYITVAGDQIAYRYEVIEEIGRGAFGKALRCYDHRSSQQVVLKILKKSNEEMGENELKALEKLKDSKFVVKMYSHFWFRDHLCFVLEVLDQSLFQYMASLEDDKVPSLKMIRNISENLLEGLNSIHQRGMAHADVKPDNILFADRSKRSVKLADLGTVAVFGHTNYTYLQSRHYRAPEVVLGMSYTQAIDMWSLGCVLYELFTVSVLFPAQSEDELLSMFCDVLGPPPAFMAAPRRMRAKSERSDSHIGFLLKDANMLFRDFLQMLLQWDPDSRPTAEQALQHDWIKLKYTK